MAKKHEIENSNEEFVVRDDYDFGSLVDNFGDDMINDDTDLSMEHDFCFDID